MQEGGSFSDVSWRSALREDGRRMELFSTIFPNIGKMAKIIRFYPKNAENVKKRAKKLKF